MNLLDSDNATSLPESEDGRSRSGLLACQTTKKLIPAVALARHSVAPAKRKVAPDAVASAYFRILSAPDFLPVVNAGTNGLLTRATCGRNFIGSNASENLQRFMASKLRERMEKYGSLEYERVWKSKDMVLGPAICALRASGRRTSGKGCSGWRTATAEDGRRGSPRSDHLRQCHALDSQAQMLDGWRSPDSNERGGAYKDPAKVLNRLSSGHQINLEDQAILAGYPTPKAEDAESSGERISRGTADTLTAVARMAGWPSPTAMSFDQSHQPGNNRFVNNTKEIAEQATGRECSGWARPSARDWKDTPGMSQTGVNPDGTIRDRTDQLPRQAAMVEGWGTPRVTSNGGIPSPETTGKGSRIEDQAGLAMTSGESLTSCTSKTEKRGALNPEHSRWLMGFPPAWTSCGVTAMRSYRKLPRNSSKRTKNDTQSTPELFE